MDDLLRTILLVAIVAVPTVVVAWTLVQCLRWLIDHTPVERNEGPLPPSHPQCRSAVRAIEESHVASAVATPADDDEPSRGDVVYLDDPAIHVCGDPLACRGTWECPRCGDPFGACVRRHRGFCAYCAGRAD